MYVCTGSSMSSDVNGCIARKTAWEDVPHAIKQKLGNNVKEYEKSILAYSLANQLRWRSSLVKTAQQNEKVYYDSLVTHSAERLMLYPYHLSDVLIKGLRLTPFSYYIRILESIMNIERSYDCLPNFTAADCCRLLGIGRNQYIDMMNKSRSKNSNAWGWISMSKKRVQVKDLLPRAPVDINLSHWWVAHVGYVTEDDVKSLSRLEKRTIDYLIDNGCCAVGTLDRDTVAGLYNKGLIYLQVPIGDDDCISVPPLENFVMNRVLGDYLETLLYKMFISIDEHTTIAEIATMLEVNPSVARQAVSMYCRLGFAKKIGSELDLTDSRWHASWIEHAQNNEKRTLVTAISLLDGDSDMASVSSEPMIAVLTATDDAAGVESEVASLEGSIAAVSLSPSLREDEVRKFAKRIAFVFDSSLTAFLMMGNLSPGLKCHAVTMFEVGKLADESLKSFCAELNKVNSCDSGGEGEAQRFFDHAVTLGATLRFLRRNPQLTVGDAESENENMFSVGPGVDLLRCESLMNLDEISRQRVLEKNYLLIVSMAPISQDTFSPLSCLPHHMGPPIPEVNSPWFKLFLYHFVSDGPPTLLLKRGSRLSTVPELFRDIDRFILTTWGHDPVTVGASNILITLNDALVVSPVLIQACSMSGNGTLAYLPFPFGSKTVARPETYKNTSVDSLNPSHNVVQRLSNILDLEHSCGYITFLRPSVPATANWRLLNVTFGIPLFDADVNRDVCEQIIEHALFSTPSLNKHSSSSRLLALRLLHFIDSHTAVSLDGETRKSTSSTTGGVGAGTNGYSNNTADSHCMNHGHGELTAGNLSLFPTHSFKFHDGVLSEFSPT